MSVVAKKVQESRRPTRKLIAASVASFLAAFLISFLSSHGVDVSPEDSMHIGALLESVVYGLMTMLTALVAGYLRKPGPNDGIKDES